jgi:diguanylate cyclase (GGDEF)-like protein
MTLDISTLLVVTIFISGMAGILMLVTWLQNRAVTALVWWGAAYLVGATAAGLFAARGHLPNFWSMNIANALLLAAAGMTWCGARSFDGKPVTAWHALIGAVIWLVACGIGEFHASLFGRIAVASAIAAVYATLTVWELWCGRQDQMIARWVAIGMFSFHGIVYLARIVLTWGMGLAPEASMFDLKWLPVGIFEALFYTFGTAFILLSMTKERAEARHRRAALVDPLTGVPNRRGFVDRATRLLTRCRADGQPVSVLLFDLDNFKRINDTYGHQVGDEVLAGFCRAAQQRCRPQDLFARLGGEEFVCLLPGTNTQAAFAIAERIRADADATRRAIGFASLQATVSIGIANTLDAGDELTGLLGAADKALYQAKAKGRNRVEGRRPPLTLVAGETSVTPLPIGVA